MRFIAKGLRASITGMLVFGYVLPASACPPPNPPPEPRSGETAQAYAARLAKFEAAAARASRERLAQIQEDQWKQADRVVIAKVVGLRPLRNEAAHYFPELQRVRLRPVAWLKGSPFETEFELYHTGATDCGPYGGGDAGSSKLDQLLVVYLKKGIPSPETMIDSYGATSIEDSAVKSILTRHAGPSDL